MEMFSLKCAVCPAGGMIDPGTSVPMGYQQQLCPTKHGGTCGLEKIVVFGRHDWCIATLEALDGFRQLKHKTTFKNYEVAEARTVSLTLF